MRPEDEKELTEHLEAIAKILYRQTEPEQLTTPPAKATLRWGILSGCFETE